MVIESVAVDFDGTLTKVDNFPNIGEINMDAVKVLSDFQELGGRVVLNTARDGYKLHEAVVALREIGFQPDCVNENLPERIKLYKNDPRKIMGDIFIDDRCIDFTGDWKKYRQILIKDNELFKYTQNYAGVE